MDHSPDYGPCQTMIRTIVHTVILTTVHGGMFTCIGERTCVVRVFLNLEIVELK